jgi:hypothetical protein
MSNLTAPLTAPKLYFGLVLLVGAVIGGGVMVAGLEWTGRLDPPPAPVQDSSKTPLAEDELEGTTPDRETVHDTTESLDTLSCVVPSFLTDLDSREPSGDDQSSGTEDETGAQEDSLSRTLPSGVGAAPTHSSDIRPRITSSLDVDAYLLPIVDGGPAVTVTEGMTKAQVYDLRSGRGRVFRWRHPDHTFTLAPVGSFYSTPNRFRFRLGVELDVKVDVTDFRIGGGIEPLPSSPLRPWLSVTVRPFSVSFL